MRIALDEVLAQQKILLLDGSMSTPLEAMGCDLNDLLWTARALADADLLALGTMPVAGCGQAPRRWAAAAERWTATSARRHGPERSI